jgi:hypothetical protein
LILKRRTGFALLARTLLIRGKDSHHWAQVVAA